MQNRGILIQIYQMTKVLQGVLQVLCFPKPIVFFLEGELGMPLGPTWKRSMVLTAFPASLLISNLRAICDIQFIWIRGIN